MPEVHIDSLTVENFGPFYGEHTLDFRVLEEKCGILIGGKNGAGKTHLLRALYLAIVGESGVGDLKKLETGSDATRFVFEKSLNRRALSEGQDTLRLKTTVSLRDEVVGSRRVEFAREIRFRPSSPPVWQHYATRSDAPGRIEDEQVIQKLRDAFLPRHLARFFFFDAERSQGMNLSQQDVIEGISRVLGYHAYAELEIDLRQLIVSKIPRVFNSNGGPNAQTTLAELSGRILTVEGLLKARRHERESLARNLREKEAELSELEDELKTLGAVDPVEMEKAQQRNAELTAAKARLEARLTEAWEMALPLTLLGSYRTELHDALAAEERRREWEGAKAAVEPKIPQVRKEVFEDPPLEFSLTSDVETFYVKRLENALHKLFNPPPDGMPERVFILDQPKAEEPSAGWRGLQAWHRTPREARRSARRPRETGQAGTGNRRRDQGERCGTDRSQETGVCPERRSRQS